MIFLKWTCSLKVHQWFFIGRRLNGNFLGKYTRPFIIQDFADLSGCILQDSCHEFIQCTYWESAALLGTVLRPLGTPSYHQDFTHSAFFAWNTFPFNLPTCLDYFSFSFRTPLQIPLLWLGTPPVRSPVDIISQLYEQLCTRLSPHYTLRSFGANCLIQLCIRSD